VPRNGNRWARRPGGVDANVRGWIWRGLTAAALAGTPGFDDGVSTPPTRPARLDDAAQATRAQALLARHQCGACHRIPGVPGAAGTRGPSLEQFGRRSYIAGRVPNDAATLARWIVAPPALVPDTTMPTLGVDEADARVMAAYLMTLS
jgi:cytochrome c